ncbi:putative basic proline-rich protein [Neofusicoccum parvum UCRNP2]|uniref:Putative basic proline-rich protein n=1 Tax=Botryosphaeria parva (strain UCR-NP2) TaxID=1287680 RepID=R1EF27_BOTPV|nr:putative basic proline-rich protein [Neofusicoccum parvum UCRNP2]
MNASSYTLTNGGSAKSSAPVSPGMLRINDGRWKFQPDSELPKPRDFTGGPKKYRAGRGSSVPLDLSTYE